MKESSSTKQETIESSSRKNDKDQEASSRTEPCLASKLEPADDHGESMAPVLENQNIKPNPNKKSEEQEVETHSAGEPKRSEDTTSHVTDENETMSVAQLWLVQNLPSALEKRASMAPAIAWMSTEMATKLC